MNPTTPATILLAAAEAADAAQPKGGYGVGAALVGVVLAVCGFLGREIYEQFKTRWKTRKDERAELQKLSSLLEESNNLFHNQNSKARELLRMLQRRLGDRIEAGLGFDRTFYDLYAELTDDERHVHALIRSTTMNSLHRVNTDMSSWLRANSDLRSSMPHKELAKQLSFLQQHLNGWHDKFAFFTKDEKHCLVYLNDERKDGTGFPRQLEPTIAKVLNSSVPRN